MPKTYIQIGGQTYDAATTTHPEDRTFRDAWQLTGNVIDVDMVAARAMHCDHIRAERITRFDLFDKISTPLSRKAAGGTALSAQEITGLNAAEADAQKLRDAPGDTRIDAATTPDELKSLTLDVLVM